MRFIKQLYNGIRPYLPRKWAVYNGVPVHDGRLLDQTDWLPKQQAGLIQAVREWTQAGDTVVDIATGRGIVATHGARQGASVTTYEAADEMVRVASQTFAANNVAERVKLVHGLVTDQDKQVWGTPHEQTIDPADLPQCDVLILDCEGAELEILANYPESPRTIIVETHPRFGAKTADVHELVLNNGYETSVQEYEPDDDSSKAVVVGVRQ